DAHGVRRRGRSRARTRDRCGRLPHEAVQPANLARSRESVTETRWHGELGAARRGSRRARCRRAHGASRLERARALDEARAALASNARRECGSYRELRSLAHAGVGSKRLGRSAVAEATRASLAPQDRNRSREPTDSADRTWRGLQARRGLIRAFGMRYPSSSLRRRPQSRHSDAERSTGRLKAVGRQKEKSNVRFFRNPPLDFAYRDPSQPIAWQRRYS